MRHAGKLVLVAAAEEAESPDHVELPGVEQVHAEAARLVDHVVGVGGLVGGGPPTPQRGGVGGRVEAGTAESRIMPFVLPPRVDVTATTGEVRLRRSW